MKFLRYFPLILTTAALLSLGSCKQDLGQDPPFDYPDEGSSGVQLPDPLYHLACDDDLFLDGTLAGEMKTFTGESPMFVDGKSGKAYQNVDGQALILTPDAASTTALKSLGNYSIFMWIKFDGTNKNAAGLFSIGNKTIEVADVAFFLNNGNTTTPSEFFFKGFMQATGASGKPDAWFDAGDDAKIQNMAGVWAHVGVTYDAGTSTITLYHKGGLRPRVEGRSLRSDDVRRGERHLPRRLPVAGRPGFGCRLDGRGFLLYGSHGRDLSLRSGVDAGTGDGTVRTGEIARLDFCIDRKRGPKSGPLF